MGKKVETHFGHIAANILLVLHNVHPTGFGEQLFSGLKHQFTLYCDLDTHNNFNHMFILYTNLHSVLTTP